MHVKKEGYHGGVRSNTRKVTVETKSFTVTLLGLTSMFLEGFVRHKLILNITSSWGFKVDEPLVFVGSFFTHLVKFFLVMY